MSSSLQNSALMQWRTSLSMLGALKFQSRNLNLSRFWDLFPAARFRPCQRRILQASLHFEASAEIYTIFPPAAAPKVPRACQIPRKKGRFCEGIVTSESDLSAGPACCRERPSSATALMITYVGPNFTHHQFVNIIFRGSEYRFVEALF